MSCLQFKTPRSTLAVNHCHVMSSVQDTKVRSCCQPLACHVFSSRHQGTLLLSTTVMSCLQFKTPRSALAVNHWHVMSSVQDTKIRSCFQPLSCHVFSSRHQDPLLLSTIVMPCLQFKTPRSALAVNHCHAMSSVQDTKVCSCCLKQCHDMSSRHQDPLLLESTVMACPQDIKICSYSQTVPCHVPKI